MYSEHDDGGLPPLVRDCRDWVQAGSPPVDGSHDTADACAAHDWWHIDRVWRTAAYLADREGGDPLIIHLASLLHDVDDRKLRGGDGTPRLARAWMEDRGCPAGLVDHVCHIIADLSFKGAGVPTPMASLEGCVVQDADRLDAIGAIGIARAFAYGGRKGRPLWVPGEVYGRHDSAANYHGAEGSTIGHFHEKLLLLADRMNTSTARQLARERHRAMEDFLGAFHREWDCR